MKGIKHLFRAEDGVSAIVISLLMVVFLSFAALVTDLGVAYYKKAELQTAVDAAALAGAYKLPSEEQATEAIEQYLQLNGVDPDDAQITYTPTDGGNIIITVACAQQQSAFFANVFGVNSLNYSCIAKATTGIRSTHGVFDYLLFSGSPSATLVLGGKFWIYGSVHSNGTLSMSPANTTPKCTIIGAAESCNGTYVNYYTCSVGQEIDDADFVPMADFTSCVDEVIPQTGFDHIYMAAVINAITSKVTLTGNTKIIGNVSVRNKLEVFGNLYVQGNLSISGGSPVCLLKGRTANERGTIFATGNINFGNTFKGDGCIFANGSIIFNGGDNVIQHVDNLAMNSLVCLYSKNGNIDFGTASTAVYGIVYAPNGNVRIVGNNTTFHGNIIGNSVSGIPAKLYMYSLGEVPLPFTIGSRTAYLVQ